MRVAKFELPPRRFFTVERLADRWECPAEDVAHLVEIKELKTVPRLAAIHGKAGIWVIPYTDPADTLGPIPDDIPDHFLPLFEPREDGESDGDVWVKAWKRVRKDGGADPVITAAEVERFESEYHRQAGEAAETATAARKPPPLPTPAVAACFDGLHGWNREKWVKNLGDPAKWMEKAITVRRNKPDPHLWDPVKLALELLQLDDTVPPKEITRRFNDRPELEAWRDAWQPYAEAYEL
jgi:hypothetical protein